MKTQKKLLALLLAVTLAAMCVACGTDGPSASGSGANGKPTVDPSGASITAPEEVSTIAVLAPSLAEIVQGLGRGEDLVAYDTQTALFDWAPADSLVLDMVEPDLEQLAALRPDVLMVTSMSLYDRENPYQQLVDLGVCVVCVPTEETIAQIESDIAFVAAVIGEEERGEQMVNELREELDRIAAIGETITEKKTVYFEISAAPYMYSFGSGVFLNEMIELIGAENILASESGWLSVSEESVVAADPDVILTNVNYLDDPVGEIMSRPGWEAITAVKNGEILYIDNMSSSLPNQNIVTALNEMAMAVYPEVYGE